MKKVFPLILFLIVVGGAWYFMGASDDTGGGSSSQGNTSQGGETGGSSKVSNTQGGGNAAQGGSDTLDEGDENEEYDYEYDDRPADEIYRTSTDALKAIAEGAKDYDDIVLEQFTELGAGCGWCDEFYSTLTDKLMNDQLTEDERSYYAEVMAISGRVANVEFLIQGIAAGGDGDRADIYAEALEFTIGGDDVVNHLSGYIESDDELLQESVVAAITNQGSPLAAETLYDHTVKAGDADGYYSLGIGLAELIPEEETLPYLQDLVKKRDKFSHLAVKSLSNYGLQGLKIVFDEITNSKDADFDKAMLEDAVDHVSYEEDIEEFLKQTVKSSNDELAKEFAKQILDDFDIEDVEDEA